ncbi:hypothetical protein SLS62_005929 [Diatrype stigma]|uniref:Uncharacterized protein n=1 Tax=Diatrype stigma TaxID=117547 RepID=A0AAN9UU53_9PEZI
MGKPSQSAGPKPSASDAVSLHSNPGGGESYRDAYRDIDDDDAPQLAVDDLPPSYGHALQEQQHPPSAATDEPSAPLVASVPNIPFIREDANTGARFYVNKLFEDPARLEQHIRQEAATPPRPYLRLVGTHTETTRDRKGKSESSTVTDFDVNVELTPFLYADAQYRRSWTSLRTVENGEKVRRGTVLAKRAPGAQQDIEVGGPDKPTLQEWCHRFGASPAGLRCFVLRRRMVGFDTAGVVYRLRRLVLDTNYRGHLVVELRTKNEVVECYNDARINRWRFHPWAFFLAVISLMIVFTWPYLWLRTKRWEVAVAEWPFSRTTDDGRKEYVSISEDQWYNMWARAIAKAVLEKRQATLDQEDLRRSQEPEPALNTGHAGVDGAVGLFRAGLSAMNEVNRHLGWGGDC